MGLCASSDIFQAKVDDLLGDIDGINMHIYDIMVPGKGSFYQNVDQLRVIFDSIISATLTFITNKCIFGLKEITYLGYIITQEGIKPDPKKYKRLWISGDLPQQLTHERSSGWPSTTWTCDTYNITYYPL